MSLIDKIFEDKIDFFVQNLKLTNYSIYIPIIIICITIIVLVILVFKRNKLTYTLLVILIIIDLFSMAFFYEGNSDDRHIRNSLEGLTDLEYLTQEDELFRILPVAPSISGYVFANNKNIHNKVSAVTGYVPFLLKDYNVVTGISTSSDNIPNWTELLKNNNVISMLNTKYILVPARENIEEFMSSIGDDYYEIIYEDSEAIMLKNNNYLPRFYFVDEVIGADSVEEVREILWKENAVNDGGKFDPEKTAIIQDLDFSGNMFDTEEAEVDIVEYKNNEVMLETNSRNDSFLVFSDSYYPGWKAYIDGNETRIYKTNGILKGIYLEKGKHTVVFKFTPGYFWILSIMSLISFISVIVMIIVLVKKRRKQQLILNGNDKLS